MINHASFKQHIYYWILPSVITLLCIYTYFYNLFGLSHLIAHPINREFGIVENLQLLFLLIIFAIAIKGIRNSISSRPARLCYRIIAAFTVVLFFEEIDYGLHYWDYFTMAEARVSQVMQIDYNTEIRNLHNNSKITNITKLISYGMIVCLFVILPLLPASIKEKFAVYKYLSPSKLIITTAISLLIVNNVALYFYRNAEHANHALNGNISEFEEIMTYYIFLLYIAELAYSQKLSMLMEHYKTRSAANAGIQLGYNEANQDIQVNRV